MMLKRFQTSSYEMGSDARNLDKYPRPDSTNPTQHQTQEKPNPVQKRPKDMEKDPEKDPDAFGMD